MPRRGGRPQRPGVHSRGASHRPASARSAGGHGARPPAGPRVPEPPEHRAIVLGLFYVPKVAAIAILWPIV